MFLTCFPHPSLFLATRWMFFREFRWYSIFVKKVGELLVFVHLNNDVVSADEFSLHINLRDRLKFHNELMDGMNDT